MTSVLDALFCYYYVVCKEKVWFATDSYGFYACAFVAGSTSFIIIFNMLVIGSVLDFQVVNDNSSEFGISKYQLLAFAYGLFAVIMLVFGGYLLKEKRFVKLIEEIKANQYQLSPLSKGVGWLYKIATALPFCVAALQIAVSFKYD